KTRIIVASRTGATASSPDFDSSTVQPAEQERRFPCIFDNCVRFSDFLDPGLRDPRTRRAILEEYLQRGQVVVSKGEDEGGVAQPPLKTLILRDLQATESTDDKFLWVQFCDLFSQVQDSFFGNEKTRQMTADVAGHAADERQHPDRAR
ncbi:unnamed protein product, partial [Amoebophrya sp. A120]